MTLSEVAHRIRAPATRPVAWLKPRLAMAILCAGFSDWLFWFHRIGVSWPLFLAVVSMLATTLNPIRADRRNQRIALIMFAMGILPSVVNSKWTSFFFALFGLIICRTILISRAPSEWILKLRRLCVALFFPFTWPVMDCLRVFKLNMRRHKPRPQTLTWHIWIVPIGCTLVFFLLFAAANPLIGDTLRQIDPSSLGEMISSGRIAFWLMMGAFVWPFLHLRAARKRVTTPVSIQPALPPVFFSAPAILYSLIPFNALFAIENLLDLGYLWFGMALPHGMTFSEYAHQGAYPLIITAILAAAFVLVAMRPNGEGQHSRPIRLLVVAWTLQNLMLVFSALRRLDLYVESYSLTYLRVAAFIWMALVAFGLATILIRILRQSTSSWLVSTNAVALGVTLYLSCFVDISAMIARYNINHCREVTGQGASLDLPYFEDLGPSVIPVLDEEIPLVADTTLAVHLQSERRRLALHADERDHNWRAWTLSSWRLRRYLDTHIDPPDPS
jgi:hypothetical protein